MIIQSKKVWIADQFMPAQIEMDGGKIIAIGKHGAKPVDVDYGDKRIIPGMIEESHEVVEAIECDSAEMLREELGDVLLQIVFHADIEREQGRFDFDDAVTDICRKMIVRHPHVFANVDAKTSDVVLDNWDKIKAKTKSQKDLGERLDSIAKPLPALVRTQKVIRKTAKERGYGMMILMLTDVLLEGTQLIYLGDDDTMRHAFSADVRDNEVFLPKVMSRKKQIIPMLTALWG